MKEKRNLIVGIVVAVIVIATVVVIGSTVFIGKQISENTDAVPVENVENESSVSAFPEYEDVENPNTEPSEDIDADLLEESDTVVEEESSENQDTTYREEREALPEEQLAEKDALAKEYVQSSLSKDAKPSEPYPALVVELSKPFKDVNWENVYLTQSYWLWWLMEKAPTIVGDENYVIAYNLENLEVVIDVEGTETNENHVKEVLNPWIEKVMQHSVYADAGETFTILYEAF